MSSVPIEFQPFNRDNEESRFWKEEGYRVPIWLDILHSVINIILVVIIFFVYPISLIFSDEFIQQNQFEGLQIICILYYTFEIGLNFVSIKTVNGRMFLLYKDIFIDYLKRKFPLDLLLLLILIIDVSV